MAYIFLDESGELGFKLTSSRHFVIVLLCCDDKEVKSLRNIPKKIKERKLKKKYSQLRELKFNNTSPEIRSLVLEKIKKLNVQIYSIILDKKQVFDYLKDKKHKLYNYVSGIIINECHLADKKVMMIVDRRGGQVLATEFNNYVSSKFKESNTGSTITITHADSCSDGGLQMADFISGAIYKKYESNEDSYFKIIESKIVTKKELFR